MLPILGEDVGRELIDRDRDDQLRPFSRWSLGGSGGWREGRGNGREGKQEAQVHPRIHGWCSAML
jgi:hypothetical protein